jgi:hypothetical protein
MPWCSWGKQSTEENRIGATPTGHLRLNGVLARLFFHYGDLDFR